MGRAKNSAGLTEREESLCQEMLKTTNQSEAYRRSTYSTDNMNPVTIQTASSKKLNMPHMKKRLEQLRGKVRDKVLNKISYDAAALLQDMIDVMAVAKSMAMEGEDSKNTAAFKGLADSIGKHINVQAFSEKSEVESSVNLNAKYSILGVEPDSD